jgi:hypothetical protein
MTMSGIEAVVGKGESDFRQAALEEIIAMQKTDAKTCPPCGTTLLNKGKQQRQVVSLRGEVRLERTYYECQDAEKAIFPFDNQLELTRSVYSPDLAQQMVWLSGLLPYRQCEQVFARIGERRLPASSIWRQTQRHGERLQAYMERQREQVSWSE